MRTNQRILGIVGLALAAAIAASACTKELGTGEVTSPSETPTYTTPVPTAISPVTGGDAGGTAVTLTGSGFMSGASVTIGGVYATSIIVVSSTTITAITAAATAGAADVVVTQGSYTGRLQGGFTYLAAADCVMTFNVYDHTEGLLGAFTQSAQSGTSVTISISDLVVSELRSARTAQGALPATDVDASRIAVRQQAANGLIGSFVGFSTAGTVTVTAPYSSTAGYDVFLMNTRNGADYSLADTASLAFGRDLTVSRGADMGGASGPDSAIDNLVTALGSALANNGMKYGRVTRAAADGQIIVTYAQPNAGACATYTRSRGTLYLNPDTCAAVPVNLSGVMLENGFELVTGLRDISGTDSSAVVDWDTLRLTKMGRDLLAYIYVKDSKTW
ncbi:MAG: IPT/TIG domain-containing protein [Acidobacteria bacterium]|nr:IPT/TIG domain-containing protein [Acidobacteriota bacterium]